MSAVLTKPVPASHGISQYSTCFGLFAALGRPYPKPEILNPTPLADEGKDGKPLRGAEGDDVSGDALASFDSQDDLS